MYQGLGYELSQVMPQVIATGLLVETFTAQAPSNAQTTTGAPTGSYVPVSGLINIPCMSAVQSLTGIEPTEIRDLEEILAKAPRHVMLNADYTALLAGWRNGWQAVITYPDGTVTTYMIIGCETDSACTHSRVEVSEVSV